MLADLSFKHENYPDAQAYYDSAVTYLQKDYPNYEELMKKHDILSRLVNNIMVVQVQDSLQRLAKMPAGERMRIINGIIAEINRKEQEARDAESQQFQNVGFLEMENRNLQQQQKSTGDWYFDNPATRSFGYSEFRNKWGDRKLEDMWRLSNRRGGDFMSEEELRLDSIRQDSIKAVQAQLKNPDYYLKSIPITPDALAASDAKIERALYNMGYIYYYELSDNDKSIEAFDLQIKRFPKGVMIPPAYYQLYQVYTKLGFHDKAAQAKNRLMREHPDHEYALILADPDYFKNRALELSLHKAFYSNTYALFSSGKFKEAAAKTDSALAQSSFSDIHPRLSLLKALIVGQMEGKASYIQALEHTSSKYKNTPESKHAADLLALLKEEEKSKPGEDEAQQKAVDYSIYAFNAGKTHLVLIMIDSKFGKGDKVKNKVSDFNRKSFSPKNLNVTSTVLSENHEMLTISSFTDAKDAMIYYNALKDGNVFAGKDADGDSAIFVISSDNYPIFFKDRDIDKYKAFFQDHYFK
jgi:TolA-binding protein